MAKIFVFDDKTENMTAAEVAITAAGHTMAPESWGGAQNVPHGTLES